MASWLWPCRCGLAGVAMQVWPDIMVMNVLPQIGTQLARALLSQSDGHCWDAMPFTAWRPICQRASFQAGFLLGWRTSHTWQPIRTSSVAVVAVFTAAAAAAAAVRVGAAVPAALLLVLAARQSGGAEGKGHAVTRMQGRSYRGAADKRVWASECDGWFVLDVGLWKLERRDDCKERSSVVVEMAARSSQTAVGMTAVGMTGRSAHRS
eukprot:364322-Chlamydomonas_euryale.AAC.2